jgi:hypothetical protein
LCTRSISAASLVLGEADALAVGLAVGLAGGAVTFGVGEGGALVVDCATADCVGAADPTVTESCVDRRPAIARPTARTTTSAKGRSVKAVEARRMTRRYGFLATVTTV